MESSSLLIKGILIILIPTDYSISLQIRGKKKVLPCDC